VTTITRCLVCSCTFAQTGLDLLDHDDAEWLLDLVATTGPDLLMIGPLYKLAGGDPTEEQVARTVAAWLHRIRHDTGCAVLIEAHSPYASSGRHRPTRPYTASLWSRWPEFGLHLSKEGQLQHWRPPRDEREWPALLQRAGGWPWTVVTRPRDQLWAGIKELCQAAGDQLSYRDLADLTGSSVGSVQRAVGEHPDAWAALAAPKTGDTP
jgi:AAA domain